MINFTNQKCGVSTIITDDKTMKTKLLLTTILAIFCLSANAQTWSTPVQVGSSIYYNLAAEGGNTVHVAYGDGTIFYRRSFNEGATWSSPITLGTGRLYLERSICVDSLDVYVVYFRNFINRTDWYGTRACGDLVMRHSANGGVTWQPEVQLTTAQGAYRVSMIASGANVYLTWMDLRSNATWDIYYRKSINYGETWQPEVQLVAGANSFGAERPDIVVNGDSVHLFYMAAAGTEPPCTVENFTIPICTGAFYKRSLDGGTTWGAATRLDPGTTFAGRPIATIVPPTTIVLTWEGLDGTIPVDKLEIYTLRSTDNGTTWSAVQQMRNLPENAGHPNITANGTNVHLAWHDLRPPFATEIYYRASFDAGATWQPEELVTNTSASSVVPILGTTTNYVHAIFGDGGGNEPYYSRRMLTNTTSIGDMSMGNNIIFYPNPFTSQTTLQTDNPLINATLSVYNCFGHTVKQIKHISGQTITLQRDILPSGVYLIQITQENKEIITKKLIVTD